MIPVETHNNDRRRYWWCKVLRANTIGWKLKSLVYFSKTKTSQQTKHKQHLPTTHTCTTTTVEHHAIHSSARTLTQPITRHLCSSCMNEGTKASMRSVVCDVRVCLYGRCNCVCMARQAFTCITSIWLAASKCVCVCPLSTSRMKEEPANERKKLRKKINKSVDEGQCIVETLREWKSQLISVSFSFSSSFFAVSLTSWARTARKKKWNNNDCKARSWCVCVCARKTVQDKIETRKLSRRGINYCYSSYNIRIHSLQVRSSVFVCCMCSIHDCNT